MGARAVYGPPLGSRRLGGLLLALSSLSACGVDSQLDVRLDWSAAGGRRADLQLSGVLLPKQRCPGEEALQLPQGGRVSLSELATQRTPVGPASLVVQAFLPSDAKHPIFAGCVELTIDKAQARRTAVLRLAPANMAIQPHMPLLAAGQSARSAVVRVVHQGEKTTRVERFPLQVSPGGRLLRTDEDGLARWQPAPDHEEEEVRSQYEPDAIPALSLKWVEAPASDWFPALDKVKIQSPLPLSGALAVAVEDDGSVVLGSEDHLLRGDTKSNLHSTGLAAWPGQGVVALNKGAPLLVQSDGPSVQLAAQEKPAAVTALGRVRGPPGAAAVTLISNRAVEVSRRSGTSLYALPPNVGELAAGDALVEAVWASTGASGWAIGRMSSGKIIRWSQTSGRRLGVDGVAVDVARLGGERWGAVWASARCPQEATSLPCFPAAAPRPGGGCLWAVVERGGGLWCTAYPLSIIPTRLCSFTRDAQTGIAVVGEKGGIQLIPAAANGALVPDRAIQRSLDDGAAAIDMDCAAAGQAFALLNDSGLTVLEPK